MKKLFMKLFGQVRQKELQPMNVKIKLHYDVDFESIIFDFDKTKVNVKMDYYDWMQYLHDEIRKYEYKTSTKYWCGGDGITEKDNTIYYKSRHDMFAGNRCTKEEYLESKSLS